MSTMKFLIKTMMFLLLLSLSAFGQVPSDVPVEPPTFLQSMTPVLYSLAFAAVVALLLFAVKTGLGALISSKTLQGTVWAMMLQKLQDVMLALVAHAEKEIIPKYVKARSPESPGGVTVTDEEWKDIKEEIFKLALIAVPNNVLTFFKGQLGAGFDQFMSGAIEKAVSSHAASKSQNPPTP